MKASLIAAVFLSSMLFCDLSYAAECASIKSQKERLKCFDAFSKQADMEAQKKKESEEKAEVDKIEREQQLKKKQENQVANKLATEKFVNERVANLVYLVLSWKNFMFNPAKVDERLKAASKVKQETMSDYDKLVALDDYNPVLKEKVKDLVAAWNQAAADVSPTSYDSERSHSVRADMVMNRFEAQADRLKLDIR